MTKYTIEKNITHHIIEWLAATLSLTGALMVSLQYLQGYAIWIIANILWILFAYKHKHYGLLLLSIGYLIINSIGFVRWQLY